MSSKDPLTQRFLPHSKVQERERRKSHTTLELLESVRARTLALRPGPLVAPAQGRSSASVSGFLPPPRRRFGQHREVKERGLARGPTKLAALINALTQHCGGPNRSGFSGVFTAWKDAASRHGALRCIPFRWVEGPQTARYPHTRPARARPRSVANVPFRTARIRVSSGMLPSSCGCKKADGTHSSADSLG